MKISRLNDRPQADMADTGAVDLFDVVGSWFNTNRSTGEIVHLNITSHGDRLALQIFGAGAPDPIPWPETTALPFTSALGSREVTGFEAHCDLGFMESHVAANLKYGVLVLQTYNRFKDDSRRGCYFTREFFHQHVLHDHGPSLEVQQPAGVPYRMLADIPRRDPNGAVSLGELTGLWKNTKRATRVIRELRLLQEGGRYLLHAAGAGAPCDWGKVPVTPCANGADALDPAGFFAVYDFGFQRMFLAANMNKGLLIIASYKMFLDGDRRSDYFTREFFYREGESDQRGPKALSGA
jgi:hypothetical protein